MNKALFGGSFDPIHLGHLQVAQKIQQAFRFDELIFIPCKQSLLKKKTLATDEQRLAMLHLALQSEPSHYHFAVDDIELQRSTPSYTIETLQTYREKYGASVSITFIMGMDSFLQLHQWHQWQQLLSFAHILVLHRPNSTQEHPPKEIATLLLQHQIFAISPLFSTPCGYIYIYDAGNYAISSSNIRLLSAQQQDVSHLLSPAVFSYLMYHRLYKNLR
jgi:nicotinate-nucleotide adenylyltransferase